VLTTFSQLRGFSFETPKAIFFSWYLWIFSPKKGALEMAGKNQTGQKVRQKHGKQRFQSTKLAA